MIPLQKKVNATAREDYRTISLKTHASKILLRVLAKSLETKAEDYIEKNQFGFRKGRGTREAIGVMRMLSENELFVCFVDFEKAFDGVEWKRMLNILKDLGVDL